MDESAATEHWQALEPLEAKLTEWAAACPENIAHKRLIVLAEKARLQRQWMVASELYDEAIALATENEYGYEAALASELAAALYEDWNKPKIAQSYLFDAYSGYGEWGAVAKVRELEKQHSYLLNEGPYPLSASRSISAKLSIGIGNATTAYGNLQSLDLASILKASQALSGEIHLERLMTSLTKIVIENAGADRCALLLVEGEQWKIKAILDESSNSYQTNAEDSAVTLVDMALVDIERTESAPLPISIVNSVRRFSKTVIVPNAISHATCNRDRYVLKHQPKSILCLPIQYQNRLCGILYLENTQTTAAFTANHIEVLTMLASQAAISLENARLYEQQEALVKARTKALAAALDNLKKSQAQLVQTEKMSSLGQMVGGIAHEINNPISFIYSNIPAARDYIKDLTSLIAAYQQACPNPSAELTEIIEDIEPDFVVEDLNNLFSSMQTGAGRVRDIVLSLRNFARLDESDLKQVDIHEGIDSTLVLLHSRLDKEDGTLPITVAKRYGTLPAISCMASQMNQVFFNILSNAIESVEAKRRVSATDYEPEIVLSSEVKENSVYVHFSDNGVGMSEDVKKKLFDPFFTTKDVGEGTGLGMAIAHQVIEKHGGSITVESAVSEGSTLTLRLPIEASL